MACGAVFVCGAAAGTAACWCFDRPHVLPVDAKKDCLCPPCLDRAIARALQDRSDAKEFTSKGRNAHDHDG